MMMMMMISKRKEEKVLQLKEKNKKKSGKEKNHFCKEKLCLSNRTVSVEFKCFLGQVLRKFTRTANLPVYSLGPVVCVCNK